MYAFRERTKNFWDWQSVPFLPSVGSFLPSRYGCSSCRWRAYKVLGGDADSVLGRCVFLLDAFSIAALLLCFTVQSLPEYREQTPSQYQRSGVPHQVFSVVSLCSASLYLTLYSLRLLCVTALPGKEELPALLAEVQQESPEDGAALLPRSVSSVLQSRAPEAGGSWEDSEVEAEEEVEEKVAWAASAPSGAAAAPCAYAAGGLCRALTRLAQFVLLPTSLIDLLSFLPVLLDLALGAPPGLLVLRVTRFLRALRLLRATTETLSFRLVWRSLQNAAGALLHALLPTLLVVLLMFSAALFYCEGGVWETQEGVPGFYRPDVTGTRRELTPFRSVVHTWWFVLVTLSTLGYGDMVPTSAVGKVVTACTIAVGIILIAVPATLVGWHFTSAFNRHSERERARAKQAREASRARGEGALDWQSSFAARVLPRERTQGALAGAATAAAAAEAQRGAVRAAVEEATQGLREELREIKAMLLKR